MDKSSFVDVKLELEEACAFLRSFTLGRPGFTQQDGQAAVARVESHCDRLKELFPSGPSAQEAVAIEAAARKAVVAAQTRLAFLRKRDG